MADAPKEYTPSFCNSEHEGFEKDSRHLCGKIEEVKDSVKTLNNRLWFGLIGIVVNIIIVLAKFTIGG